MAEAPNRFWLTATLMVATVMQVLDSTIANVALPHMQGSLGATQDQIAWVLTSYIVAAAIMTPPTGWLAGKFGARRVLLWSLVGFTATSVLCGLSASLGQIVVFRLAQGMFGAAIVPLSQAVIMNSWPQHKQSQAMAIWGMGVMAAPILGPVLGGWLTEELSWRWVFFINLPIGVLGCAGVLAFVPTGILDRGRRLDLLGFAFLSLTIGSLQLALDRGEQLDWFESTEIVIEFALVGLGLWLFVIHSLTARHPFIDLRIFADRNFSTAVFLSAMLGLVLYGTLALLPNLLQRLLGYPVDAAGMLMAPRGFGVLLAMFLVGRFSHRLDPRVTIAIGLLISAWSMHRMAGWSLQMPASEFAETGFFQGLGFGLLFVPLTTIAFTSLPPSLRIEASGFFMLMRNLGGSIGISIAVAQLTQSTQRNHALLAEHLTPYGNLAAQGFAGDPASLTRLNAFVTQQAAMVAYVNVFQMLGWGALAMLALLLVVRRPRASAGVAEQHVVVEA